MYARSVANATSGVTCGQRSRVLGFFIRVVPGGFDWCECQTKCKAARHFVVVGIAFHI